MTTCLRVVPSPSKQYSPSPSFVTSRATRCELGRISPPVMLSSATKRLCSTTASQLKAMIGPSVLAADMSMLAEESRRVCDLGADYLHLDVMDGHFVPNLTFGAPVIESLAKHTRGFHGGKGAFLDAHLMVTRPSDWIEDMAAAGCHQFVFHVEVEENTGDVLQAAKKAGMQTGLALRPGTSIEAVLPHVDEIDMVLVMTVEPGFGGQSFMPDMMDKVSTLRQRYPGLNIQVDGGIGPKTIDVVAEAGANWIVAGSAVFQAEDPAAVMQEMKGSIARGIARNAA